MEIREDSIIVGSGPVRTKVPFSFLKFASEGAEFLRGPGFFAPVVPKVKGEEGLEARFSYRIGEDGKPVPLIEVVSISPKGKRSKPLFLTVPEDGKA